MFGNKKSQIIRVTALFLLFFIIYSLWLSSWLSTVGQIWIETQSLTGVELFFASNLNLLVLLASGLGMLAVGYYAQS